MSSSERSLTTTLAYTIAALAVARITWQNTPQWVKNGIPGTGKSKEDGDTDGDANDWLANPTTVWTKVNEVMNLAYELSEDLIRDDMPNYKMYCCFMSMVHLMKEIDANHPEWREAYFAKDGVDVTEGELDVLTKYVDLAQWSYLDSQIEVEKLLRPLGYKLIRFDNATEPGRVGHFVAVHHGRKEVVISIKGTSTLSDVLTDVIGKAIPHTMEGKKEIRCHEGMYTAAQLLLEETVHLIEKFFIPQGYKLFVCGHSLGAGVSCLLGLFLKQHIPDIDLQVYAFATPACCSYDASLDCKDYITSVVNNNDCVPRLSLMNLRMLNKLLALVDVKLDEKGLSPDSFKKSKLYLSDLMTIDANLLLTPRELTNFLETEFNEPRNDRFLDMELYVPGRVVSIWQHVADSTIMGGKVTDGQSQVLKQIFVETNMVTDHSCDTYRVNLLHLLEQTANTI
jgi:hypothetical protein